MAYIREARNLPKNDPRTDAAIAEIRIACHLNAYATVTEAKAGIGTWLAFYNEGRKHQSLGYRTPRQIYEPACGYVDDRLCRTAPLPPLPE